MIFSCDLISNKLYFAYGGNTNKNHMTKHYPDVTFVSKGILKGYKIIFRDTQPFKEKNTSLSNLESAYCDIIKSKDDSVEGVLYKLDNKSKEKLDNQEKVPLLYLIKEVEVETEVESKVEKINVFTYVMREDIECKIGIPSERYYNIVKNGYQMYNLKNKLDCDE